jgi:hypothetical protein
MFAHETADQIIGRASAPVQDYEWQAALASSPSLRALVLANGEEPIYLTWRMGMAYGALQEAKRQLRAA